MTGGSVHFYTDFTLRWLLAWCFENHLFLCLALIIRLILGDFIKIITLKYGFSAKRIMPWSSILILLIQGFHIFWIVQRFKARAKFGFKNWDILAKIGIIYSLIRPRIGKFPLLFFNRVFLAFFNSFRFPTFRNLFFKFSLSATIICRIISPFFVRSFLFPFGDVRGF